MGLGFRVLCAQGLGFRVFRLRAPGFQGLGFRVSCFMMCFKKRIMNLHTVYNKRVRAYVGFRHVPRMRVMEKPCVNSECC